MITLEKSDSAFPFYERFRSLVDNSSLETHDFCDRWEISRYQFYNWYNNRGCPDFNKLCLIRKTFDVSYEYLLGESDEKKPVNPDINLHPKAKELLQEYREFLKQKYPVE